MHALLCALLKVSLRLLIQAPDTLTVTSETWTDTLYLRPLVSEHDVDLKPASQVVESLGESAVEISAPASHLLFRGIPVDGTPQAFGEELAESGFRCLSPSLYKGTFAGVEDCMVTFLSSGSLVWKVSVFFPVCENWSAAKKQYLQFKDWFSYKYVVSPQTVREKLSQRFPEGSGAEAWGFEGGVSSYFSLFELEGGSATVYVSYDKSSGKLRVCIDYIDRVNSAVKDMNDMSDI